LRAESGRAVTSRPGSTSARKIDDIVVSAELPGLEEKDVDITLTDNVLLIRGEKKLEKEEKERGYTYTERSYGSFQRRIPIDAEVLSDKVSAVFKNGCSRSPTEEPRGAEARQAHSDRRRRRE
jgi:HSP20 family protein